MSNVNQTTCKHGAAYHHDYQLSGVTLGPPFPLDTVERAAAFPFDPRDVLVAAYPQSGEALLGDIVWLLMNEADTESAANVPLGRRLPLLELAGPGGAGGGAVGRAAAQDPPRVVATHLPYSLIGDAVHRGRPRVVVVLRDPKDLVLAQYRSYRKWPGRHLPSFSYFFETFVRPGRTLFGGHVDHLLGYWARRHDPHVLVLKYGDVRRRVEDSVLQISNFLEKDLTPKQMHAIVRYMSGQQAARGAGADGKVYVDTVLGVKLFEAELTSDLPSDLTSDCRLLPPGEEKRDREKDEGGVRGEEGDPDSRSEGPGQPPLEVEIVWAPQQLRLSPAQAKYFDDLSKERLEPAGLHFD